MCVLCVRELQREETYSIRYQSWINCQINSIHFSVAHTYIQAHTQGGQRTIKFEFIRGVRPIMWIFNAAISLNIWASQLLIYVYIFICVCVCVCTTDTLMHCDFSYPCTIHIVYILYYILLSKCDEAEYCLHLMIKCVCSTNIKNNCFFTKTQTHVISMSTPLKTLKKHFSISSHGLGKLVSYRPQLCLSIDFASNHTKFPLPSAASTGFMGV